MPSLRAFELPFVYEEAGERREASVKVKICRRCTAKLVWKPGDERKREEGEDIEPLEEMSEEDDVVGPEQVERGPPVRQSGQERSKRYDEDKGESKRRKGADEAYRERDRGGRRRYEEDHRGGDRSPRRISRSRSPRGRHRVEGR